MAAHFQRRRLGEAIDRRFFRERYDARRLLRAVAAETGQACSFVHVAPGVVARIEAALHPEFAAIMQRQVSRFSRRFPIVLLAKVANCGYGFTVAQGPAGKVVGHGGGFDGINSQLDIYVDAGYIIVVMSNYDNGASPLANKIGRTLARVKAQS